MRAGVRSWEGGVGAASGAAGMDAEWPTDAARVPEGRSLERAWRWCVLRTLRDMRLAAARGKTMSRANTRRLVWRRWQRLKKSGDYHLPKEALQWLRN